MAKDTKKPIRNGIDMENKPTRDDKGRIVSGVLNPNGRTQGRKDFYTDFKLAIQRIKDKNTGEVLTEEDIIKIGLEKMLKGDARFEGLYKDLLDRVYGKPQQTISVDATVETNEGISKEQKEKLLKLLK